MMRRIYVVSSPTLAKELQCASASIADEIFLHLISRGFHARVEVEVWFI